MPWRDAGPVEVAEWESLSVSLVGFFLYLDIVIECFLENPQSAFDGC